MPFDEHDLSFVAPHRRNEVRRRIRIIEEYIKSPSAAAAHKAAKDLGVSESSLHVLVRVWREKRRPDALAGSGRPRKERDQLTQAQKDVILDAAGEMPDALLQRVIDRAILLGEERQVQMPGWNALRVHVKKALGPRMPASSFASGADYAIDHVAIDMPVKMPTGEVAMPIATIFLSTRAAEVMGLALSTDGPSFAGAAFATVDALERGIPEDGPFPSLAFELFPGRDWERLEAGLRLTGLQIMAARRSALGRGGPAATLLGDRHHGIRLRPRLTTRKPADRAATLPTGASPLTFNEAEDLLRARWIVSRPDSASPTVEMVAAANLIRLLPLDRHLDPRVGKAGD